VTVFSPGMSPARLRIEAAGLAFKRRQEEQTNGHKAIRKAAFESVLARSAMRRTVIAKYDRVLEMAADPDRKSCMAIIREVARMRGFEAQDILGATRKHGLVCARHEAMYICSKTGKSYVVIARIFKKDHTSVMHGVRKHAERLERVERMKAHAAEGKPACR